MNNRIHTFKLERDKSELIHKIIGILFILIALALLIPYFLHFLKITIAMLFLSLGFYFITKQTRFRWFRIRRF
jgi:hypothetical protein